MLLTLVIFLLILGLMVFVHECGHFFTARKLGVKCNEFGFGFPPRICGIQKLTGKKLRKIGESDKVTVKIDDLQIGDNTEIIKETITEKIIEIDEYVTYTKWRFFWGSTEPELKEDELDMKQDTIYSLNWIPLGGFVQIKGENGEGKEETDSFAYQKIWKRALILSAGVTMKVVLCAVLLMFAYGFGAPQAIDENGPAVAARDVKIQIVSILDKTPAADAGFMMGDVLIAIDNQQLMQVKDVQTYIAGKAGQDITVQYERLGVKKEFTLKPTILKETGLTGIGVALSKTGIVSYPWYEAVWLGLKGTYLMFIQIIVGLAMVIKNAVIHQPLGVDVAGPVGIAVMTGRIARMGFVYILQFTAMLSLNLAIINFLPIPALDGGRVLFLIIEKLRGRAINQKVEQVIHTVGFSLLMLLVVVVTGSDIWGYKDWFVNIWDRIIG